MILFLVARFATEKIQPLVSEMDQSSEMDESIIKGMFDQGVSLILESCYQSWQSDDNNNSVNNNNNR